MTLEAHDLNESLYADLLAGRISNADFECQSAHGVGIQQCGCGNCRRLEAEQAA